MSSNNGSSSGSKRATTVPGVYVDTLQPSPAPATQKLFMSEQDWADIKKDTVWSSEASPSTVTLEDMKRLVKKLVPAIFSMKTRTGPVVPQLRNLLRRMQTLHNAKILADKNLEEANRAVRALERGSKDFQDTVRWVGTKLPAVVGGPVTLELTQSEAEYLSAQSKELVISWGEKHLEEERRRQKPNRNGDLFPPTSQVDDLLGRALLAGYDSEKVSQQTFMKHAGVSMGTMVSQVPGYRTQLLVDLQEELMRQGFVAKGLKVTEDQDTRTLVVSLESLVQHNSAAVLSKRRLKEVFDKHVPVGVAVESVLL